MAVQDHIRTLRTKHANLDQLINRESARPMPDGFKLSEMKREKLRIKDSIAALERHH
jgi:hypothetical protein